MAARPLSEVPSWSIRRALRRAARQGVDVLLLLSGPRTVHPALHYAARRYYPSLLQAGVHIWEYQPRFVHAKVALCDDWVSLGSCNMDHWNLRWNLEANQEVEDGTLATQVARSFSSDLELAEEVSLAVLKTQPWYRRLRAFLLGALSALVLRLL